MHCHLKLVKHFCHAWCHVDIHASFTYCDIVWAWRFVQNHFKPALLTFCRIYVKLTYFPQICKNVGMLRSRWCDVDDFLWWAFFSACLYVVEKHFWSFAGCFVIHNLFWFLAEDVFLVFFTSDIFGKIEIFLLKLSWHFLWIW